MVLPNTREGRVPRRFSLSAGSVARMVESELRPSHREEDEVIRDHTSESDTALSPNAVFALETSIPNLFCGRFCSTSNRQTPVRLHSKVKKGLAGDNILANTID
jgi:hypothetical protein